MGGTFGMVNYRGYRDQNLSFLAKESECMAQGGMECVSRVVIGCM